MDSNDHYPRFIKCATGSCTKYLDVDNAAFENISFFKAPASPKGRQEWCEQLNIEFKQSGEEFVVCAEHKPTVYTNVYDETLCLEPEVILDVSQSIIKTSSCEDDHNILKPEDGLIHVPASVKLPPKISPKTNNDTYAVKSLFANGEDPDSNDVTYYIKPKSTPQTVKRKRGRPFGTSKQDMYRRRAMEDRDWGPTGQKRSKKQPLDDSEENISEPDDENIHASCSRSSETVESETNIPPSDPFDDDPSLPVEWEFFKSLIPDVRKLNFSQKSNLKTFMLDILNAHIYRNEPISLKMKDTFENGNK